MKDWIPPEPKKRIANTVTRTTPATRAPRRRFQPQAQDAASRIENKATGPFSRATLSATARNALAAQWRSEPLATLPRLMWHVTHGACTT